MSTAYSQQTCNLWTTAIQQYMMQDFYSGRHQKMQHRFSLTAAIDETVDADGRVPGTIGKNFRVINPAREEILEFFKFLGCTPKNARSGMPITNLFSNHIHEPSRHWRSHRSKMKNLVMMPGQETYFQRLDNWAAEQRHF